MRRAMCTMILGLIAAQLAGCTIMNDVKHRVRKINRNPPPSMDPDFMSSDTGIRTQDGLTSPSHVASLGGSREPSCQSPIRG